MPHSMGTPSICLFNLKRRSSFLYPPCYNSILMTFRTHNTSSRYAYLCAWSTNSAFNFMSIPPLWKRCTGVDGKICNFYNRITSYSLKKYAMWILLCFGKFIIMFAFPLLKWMMSFMGFKCLWHARVRSMAVYWVLDSHSS